MKHTFKYFYIETYFLKSFKLLLHMFYMQFMILTKDQDIIYVDYTDNINILF